MTPFADKVTHQIADYTRKDQPFAALVPTDLLNEIERDKDGKIDEQIREKRQKMAKVVVSSVNLVWLISWPSNKLDGNCKILFSKQQEQVEVSEDHPEGFDALAMESIEDLMKMLAFTRPQKKRAKVVSG